MKIDFHTHILPAIDDGAGKTEESSKMLEELRGQGIEIAVLTPHYYRDEMTVGEFVNTRKEAYSELMTVYNDKIMPRLMLGCECAMWDGMSGADLSPLCIEDTNMLMCEMPYTYRSYIIDELEELKVSGYLPVIAHIDRYFKLYERRRIAELCRLENVIFQVNAASLTDFWMRGELSSMARSGCEFILGTDCHDLHTRKPEIKKSVFNKISLKKYFMPSVTKNEECFFDL